jgi:hypothetical protein
MARSKRPEPSTIGATQGPEGDLLEVTRLELDSGAAEEGTLQGLGLLVRAGHAAVVQGLLEDRGLDALL